MASAHITGRTRPTKVKKHESAQKRKRADVSAEQLEQAVESLEIKGSTFKDFTELPLSEPTKAGLKAGHFTSMTDIQAKAIPLALKGADILGAAKTGSGKTLAFLIPVLENLYRAQCIGMDAGLGAMIISPTRELAAQIFDVLRKIGGKGHMFAAGLVIGGKSLQEEQDSLARMNILVCTPGRILQHLSQTAAFDVDNLQMLVLDEADRILDMGFQKDVDAIVEYLPKKRQTLLFSATQTKKVSDLARLSLNNPEYVAVHETAASATPKNLQQNYIITPLPQKLDTLWSFIQTEKKSKIVVFLSSGKQVRFVFEAFRKLQPGIPLLHLLGRQKQTTRLQITSKFSSAKHACLFATDVAARGLDFPAVDWVVQLDCPEDADTYIHRVGRTARYEREGRAVLFLDPTEEAGMLQRLEQKKVPIERINVRQKKKESIKDQLVNLCFQDPQLKYLAQKTFIAYVRSIHLQKDKEIFDVNALALEDFSASLGLPGAPRIKFLNGESTKQLKNAPRQLQMSDAEEDEEDDDPATAKSKATDPQVRTKHDRMFERKNQDVLADHYSKLKHDDFYNDSATNGDVRDVADHSDDDFLAVKQRIPASTTLPANIPTHAPNGEHTIVSLPGAAEPLIIDSKRREKLLKSKKKLLKYQNPGAKIIFDDEGNAHPLYELQDEAAFHASGKPEEQREKFVREEAERVKEADVRDKEVVKQKRREKKEKRKAREREEAEGDAESDDGGVEADEDVFANFARDAQMSDDEDEAEEELPKPKRAKKWFEDESDDEDGEKARKKGKRRQRQHVEEPETLEDLEALAAGILN